MDWIIAESVERMAGRRNTDLGHDRKERRVIFVNHGVRVRSEKPRVLRSRGISSGLEALSSQAGAEPVAAGGRGGKRCCAQLNDIAALGDGVGDAEIAAKE